MYDIFVQAVGFIGMFFCVWRFQLKSSKYLILWQVIGNLFFALQYILLGAYSGCIMLFIVATSGFIKNLEGRKWAEWKGWRWIFSAMVVIACIYTRSKPYDLIVLIPSVVDILTVWTGNGNVIRIGKVAAIGPLWIVYNIFAGSFAGILNESIGIISSVISIWRYGFKPFGEPAKDDEDTKELETNNINTTENK